MSFLGDLLYPDNPTRRDEVNTLQTDISNANNQLISSVNNYNDQFNVVKKVILSNYYLQAASISLSIHKQPIPVSIKDNIKSYSDPVMITVMDYLLAFGITGFVVPYFAKSAWAFGKLALQDSSAPAAGNLAENIGDVSVEEFVELMQGMTRASNIRSLGGESADFTDASFSESMSMEMSEVGDVGEMDVAIANVERQAVSVDETVVLMAEASSALKLSAGMLVVTLGLDLILDAVSGGQQRSALKNSLKILEGSQVKLTASQAAIDKAQETLDAMQKDAEDSFEKIYRAFVALNNSLSTASPVLQKAIPMVSDFEDTYQVVSAQSYLCSNFQNIVPFISIFKSMIESAALTLENFDNPETTPDVVLDLLSQEHDISIEEVKALMVWFKSEYIDNKPKNTAS